MIINFIIILNRYLERYGIIQKSFPTLFLKYPSSAMESLPIKSPSEWFVQKLIKVSWPEINSYTSRSKQK